MAIRPLPTANTLQRRCHGFTLIELLVVISIIALLVSILLPALAKSRLSAWRIQCAAQLRQVGYGHLNYAEDYQGWFPSTHWVSQAGIGTDATTNIDPLSWYGNNENLLLCPDTEWFGPPIGTHSYGPSFWGITLGGIKMRWTAYRFTAARGTNTSGYTFYGLHRSSGHPTPNDNRISPVIPRLQMAGQTITDSANGWVHYMHEPSEMPLAFDGRSNTNTIWSPYTGTLNAYFSNNHAQLGGANIAFLDGHVKWGDQTNDPLRVSTYGSSWMRWE